MSHALASAALAPGLNRFTCTLASGSRGSVAVAPGRRACNQLRLCGISERMTLEIGDAAPAFDLPSTGGGRVSLASLRGKKFVLYFYPKDDTPGCTTEACDFRDNLARVSGAGAQVFGVSKDSVASHDKFRGKYSLPFPLLSDEGSAVAREYGAYGKKLMYGRPVEGTIRSTFLIDEAGKIARVWSPVRVPGHVDQVIAALHEDPKAGAPDASASTTSASKKKAAPEEKAAPGKSAAPAKKAAPAAKAKVKPGAKKK